MGLAAVHARRRPASEVLAAVLGGADLAGFHPLDLELGRAWGQVLVWAERDGAARPRTLGEMQALSQAYILSRAAPPEACGPEIPAAPARGAMRLARPVRMALDAKGKWAVQDDGWQGRAAAIEADAFDLMSRAALRRGQPLPFSGVQIDTGRQYRALVEFRAAGTMKLSSIEGRAGGSGHGGSDYLDRFRQAGEDLARMRRWIGDGVAMEVRRVRPSKRGTAARGIITDRALVDAVCLSDQTLSAVLQGHGWARSTAHIAALRGALGAALGRMAGRVQKPY